MYPQILGVYARKSSSSPDESGCRKRSSECTFWFVRRLSEDEFEVRPLNASHVPTGVKTLMTKGELAASFVPEPRYYENHTLPALKSLQKKIELGEQFFNKGLLSKAEKEFLKATMIDEDNAEANMGLGQVYAERGEFQKIKKVLKRLMNSDMAFQVEQRRQFNAFGIALRKQKLYSEAIQYYSKALEHNEKDENLHFNLARAHFESGDDMACLAQLEAALNLRPDFEVAKKFMAYVGRN